MVWIHVVLMAAGFYALGADVQGLSRKEALLFSGGALLLMVPLGISWVHPGSWEFPRFPVPSGLLHLLAYPEQLFSGGLFLSVHIPG